MVKYKLLGHTHSWDGDCFLSDIPSKGYMSTIKNESQAKEFYKEHEKETEEDILHWGLTFEKIGKSESSVVEKPKPKATKRKKG